MSAAILGFVGANETLDFLLGRWRVGRTVTDHQNGGQSHCRGTATFSPFDNGTTLDDDHVRFDEVGEYRVGDYRGEAHRSLEYVASSDSRVVINFTDGHHFIDLNLAAGESRDEHLCKEDRYEITTVVTSPDIFEERWHVEGPQKNYDAVTTFVRIDPSDLG
jgi:hypothetical protein